ncbi:hypothetical protein [Streptomyces sp. NPDC020742]|uniref:hypothetical protein n=1 Tax=unclassified Streptomyces TaxID=2593676 RepID=UPI0033D4737C
MSTPQEAPQQGNPSTPPSADERPTLEELFEQAAQLRAKVQNHTEALGEPWAKRNSQ